MCHSNSFYSNYYPGSSWDGKIPFREQFRQWQHRSTQMCEPGAGEEGRWLWEGSPKAQPWVPGGREGSLSVWTDGSSQRSLCAASRATARLKRGRKAERVTQMHPTGRASVTGAGSLAWNSDSVSWSRVSSDRRRQQLWEGTQVHVVSVAGAGGSASARRLSHRETNGSAGGRSREFSMWWQPLLGPAALRGAQSEGNCTAMSGARTDPGSDGGPLGGSGSIWSLIPAILTGGWTLIMGSCMNYLDGSLSSCELFPWFSFLKIFIGVKFIYNVLVSGV